MTCSPHTCSIFSVRLLLIAATILGQVVGALGLPWVSWGNKHTSVTACGCSLDEQKTGRCCCRGTAATPVPSCCTLPAKKPSCCISTEEPEPEPVVSIDWVGGIMQQKCHGTDKAPGASPSGILSFSAESSPLQLLPRNSLGVVIHSPFDLLDQPRSPPAPVPRDNLPNSDLSSSDSGPCLETARDRCCNEWSR